MQILGLRLSNFRVFDDLDLELAPGMNLIRGPNESGKSTIVSAVVAGLFEKPRATNVKVKAAYRWGAAEGPVVEMEFVHEGSRFRLLKDFGQKAVLLEDLEGGEKLKTAKAVESRMTELLGFGDSGNYLRTACVTHDQMVGLASESGGAGKLAGMLREVVVGGRESDTMEAAIKSLAGEVDELKRGMERPTNNPGTVRRLQEEREGLTSRQKELAGAVSQVEGNRERLAGVEGGIKENAPKLADLEALLEKNSRLLELDERLAEARARFSSAEGVREAKVSLERIDGEIEASFPGLEKLDPDVAVELQKEIEVRQSIAASRDELAREVARAAGAGRGRRALWGWATVGAGAAVAALGAVLGTVHAALFIILAAGAALLAAGAYLLLKGRGAAGGGAGMLMEGQLESAAREIEKLEARERALLESYGFTDAPSFLRAFQSHGEKLAERGRAAAALEALLRGSSLEGVEAERKKASLEVTAGEERSRELEPFRVDPERLASLEREFKTLSGEVEDLKKESEALSFHLGQSTAQPEEALELEERISWLWEEEQGARRRLKAYARALDAMKLARESLLSSAVPALAESVGQTLSTLTGGRYRRVEIREGDLGISVFSSDKGGMIDADELLSTLSKGTVSQLYLAARLRLAEVLSGGRRPPLVFDDAFSYFDDARLGLLWDILLEVSREQQVLVLTCCGRYDELAGPGVNVVELHRNGA